MVVGPGGGRATRPRAPAVRDGPRRARRAVSPGGCGAPPSVYRRQTPANAARWLLVLRYYCEYAVS